ncbi:MAG: helix-hairpin-helix domain-containing protein [Balneolaceae bacterium]|nr:helix-hairpin-helix domain-containing protein [Balneolaceae bacterium]
MKRKIFFWLEKLKISRAERYAVTVLMIILAVLVLVNAIVTPSSPFEQDYYKEVEEEFRRRTAMLEQKEQRLLARYEMDSTPTFAQADTIPSKQAAESGVEGTMQIIDINTADAQTLQQLPGIGPSYAARIVTYRRQNGGFASKDDLLEIKGIGKARLEKIKPLIKVSEGEADVTSIALDSLPMPDEMEKSSPKEKEEAESGLVINVNTADTQTLQKLPGIGPAYAKHIVEYRQKHGSFTDKDELLKIKGIGKKRLAKIKPFIKLTGQ